jgi:hypothetical protein
MLIQHRILIGQAISGPLIQLLVDGILFLAVVLRQTIMENKTQILLEQYEEFQFKG